MSYRMADVYVEDQLAGRLEETDSGYAFTYRPDYLKSADSGPVSLTLPMREEPYRSAVLFPFFDGLIPEGWLLEVVESVWKANPRDRMGLLLVSCRECIGNVSIVDAAESAVTGFEPIQSETDSDEPDVNGEASNEP